LRFIGRKNKSSRREIALPKTPIQRHAATKIFSLRLCAFGFLQEQLPVFKVHEQLDGISSAVELLTEHETCFYTSSLCPSIDFIGNNVGKPIFAANYANFMKRNSKFAVIRGIHG
jgi:hypothetical protein